MADFTNVEVTDTFDQWRIKTNQLGSDFIAFEAQAEEDIANIDLSGLAPLSHTHPINDIINLQSSLDSKANQSTTYTKTETDAKYVTLSTAQSVTGDKTFTKSLTASGGISSPSVNITGSASTNKLTIASGKMRLRNQDYTWPSSYAAGRYLKTDAQGNLSWEEVAGGTGDVNLSTLVFNDIVPVGTIIPWAATSLPADGKWKFCNGEEVSNTTYPQISELLGNRYGAAASGKTKLPNFAGRVPLGAGGAFSVGGTGGSANITGTTAGKTLTQENLPSGIKGEAYLYRVQLGGRGGVLGSSQDLRGTNLSDDGNSTAGGDGPANLKFDLGGQDVAHSHSISLTDANYQPYLTTQYIIKVLPDDVQQVSINAGNGINVKNASDQDTTTLDLFSTKIELKTDPSQFKFSSSGLLQLVTPAVSQASITSQINTAVSGLATKAYVDSNGITQSTGPAPYYGVRAWCHYNGSSQVIHAQGNIASVTRHGKGDYEFFFTEEMPSSAYAISLSYSNEVTSTINVLVGQQHTVGFIISHSATSFRVQHYAVSSSNHPTDKAYVGVSVIC
jgi:microcystin-dependent protein